jgi:hypothetical protein
MTAPETIAKGRRALARGVLLYAALTALDGTVVWYIVSSGVRGIGYVSLTLVSAFGLLLLAQLVSHARDLRGDSVQTEGEILRKWQRAELFVAWPSYFIQIQRSIFRITPQDYILLQEGQHVTVSHFRHTNNVLELGPAGAAPAIPGGP